MIAPVIALPSWRLNLSLSARTRLARPAAATLVLILVAAALRLAFAGMTGLGMDESYMVAAGREVQLSYYDHPPLSWWLCWLAAHLLPGPSTLTLRLPFIVLFGLTTWLCARIAVLLSSPRAGFATALALNLAPLFGVTTGSWILPDGPLDAALAGFALCLLHALRLTPRDRAALRPTPRDRTAWWIGAGLCAGLAMLSKYSASLVLAGAVFGVVTQPAYRSWLRRPQPWLAACIAVAMLAPVFAWNTAHHWSSFSFQAGRAIGSHFRPAAPFIALGAQALFVLPWIWALLLLAVLRASHRGRAHPQSWLLLCCGLPPILLFTAIGLWSAKPVLFHWAAPGYLMLFPLLGDLVAHLDRARRRLVLRGAWASGALVVSMVAMLATQASWNWLPLGFPDPLADAIDWTSLRASFAADAAIAPERPVVAAVRWHVAGKLDYALAGAATVICLGGDPREYGIVRPLSQFRGRDVIILAPRSTLSDMRRRYGTMFARISASPALLVTHAGRPALLLTSYVGHDFRPLPDDRTAQMKGRGK